VNDVCSMGCWRVMLNSFLHTDISGVPGTGKTATVYAVVKELRAMAERSVCSIHM
jgi:Cdc6-like AAA superfamily ATPase